jgi:hypothetical protein
VYTKDTLQKEISLGNAERLVLKCKKVYRLLNKLDDLIPSGINHRLRALSHKICFVKSPILDGIKFKFTFEIRIASGLRYCLNSMYGHLKNRSQYIFRKIGFTVISYRIVIKKHFLKMFTVKAWFILCSLYAAHKHYCTTSLLFFVCQLARVIFKYIKQ